MNAYLQNSTRTFLFLVASSKLSFVKTKTWFSLLISSAILTDKHNATIKSLTYIFVYLCPKPAKMWKSWRKHTETPQTEPKRKLNVATVKDSETDGFLRYVNLAWDHLIGRESAWFKGLSETSLFISKLTAGLY